MDYLQIRLLSKSVLDHLRSKVVHENRTFCFENHFEPQRTAFLQRDSHEQIAKGSQRSLAALDFQPSDFSGIPDHVDDAYISEITYSQFSYRIQCLLVLEARAQQSSDLRQESLINLET